MSKMVRAKLQAADGAGTLEFMFNPSEYSVSKSAKWETPPNMKDKAGGKPHYKGSDPQTISMQIFFDDWESAVGDVTKQVDQLFAWCAPSRMSVSAEKHQPSPLELERMMIGMSSRRSRSSVIASPAQKLASLQSEMIRSQASSLRAGRISSRVSTRRQVGA